MTEQSKVGRLKRSYIWLLLHVKYSAALLRFLGSKNISEALLAPPKRTRAFVNPAGSCAPGPGRFLTAARCLRRLQGASGPPPRAARTGDKDERLRFSTRRWTRACPLPERAGPGRGGCDQRSAGQRSPQAPEPSGGANPTRGRNRGVASAPTPGRSARPAAGGTRATSNQRLLSAKSPASSPSATNQRAPEGAFRHPPPPLLLIQARCAGNPRIRS